MNDLLDYYVDSHTEAGGAKDALRYKWLRLLADDSTRRNELYKGMSEAYRAAYPHPMHEEMKKAA